MAEKTMHFICRNNFISDKEHSSYGNSCSTHIEYEKDEKGEPVFVTCKICGTQYIVLDDETTFVFIEKLEITSFTSFREFLNSFYAKELFIHDLVIKGVSDSEDFESTISFRDCRFNEVLIEDVDINVSCYPIAFDSCVTERFIVRGDNTIRHKNRYDYWSPYHFFGLNIVRTTINEIFEINNLKVHCVL